MNKLALALASIIAQLHWAPGHKPFFDAVVEENEALTKRVEALENDPALNEIRAMWNEEKARRNAEAAALAAQPAPTESSDTGENAIDLLAQPDPVAAGPDTSIESDVKNETLVSTTDESNV